MSPISRQNIEPPSGIPMQIIECDSDSFKTSPNLTEKASDVHKEEQKDPSGNSMKIIEDSSDNESQSDCTTFSSSSGDSNFYVENIPDNVFARGTLLD